MEVMVSTVLRAFYHWERPACRYFIGDRVGIRHTDQVPVNVTDWSTNGDVTTKRVSYDFCKLALVIPHINSK
jgi:hypothetical protein